MDKRTLVFVVLCAATFFGINLYYSSQRDKQQRARMAQERALNAQKTQEQTREIESKKAPLADLPVATLTLDNQTVAYGVNADGCVVTLSWDAQMPGTLYFGKTQLQLLTKETIVGAPVVYAPADFDALHIANVPNIGTYDVQILTFSKGEEPRVYYGKYQDGNLIPYPSHLAQNALVIYKTETGYLPFGYYEAESKVFIELQNLPLLSQVPFQKKFSKETAATSEVKYYVLENETMQIVFTNKGGAVTEINLPFHDDAHPQSVVKEIGFDRDMVEQNPQNAKFPLVSYYKPGSDEKHEGKVGGYYPLLRRNIVGKNGSEIPAEYLAFNLVSDYPELATLQYSVKEYTKNHIVFEATQAYRKIRKTYTLKQDECAPYILNLELSIEGDRRGLWLTSGLPEVELMSNSSSPQIQYRISRKEKSEVEKLDLPKPKEVITVSSVHPDWVVNSNGYLGVIMDPVGETASGYRARAIDGTIAPTRLSLIDLPYQPYKPGKYPAYLLSLPIAATQGTTNFRLYAGPFEETTLKDVDAYFSNAATGYNPDYISTITFYGWLSFISKPFAKVLFVVMKFFYNLTHSWAAAIILLTIFLRVLLYPLNTWSMKSMYRMREISPQVQALQKKYKKDPKKAQMEIMNLYREKKVNPFTGCLPILIQLPFLIAMFDLLKSSFALRGASFIPGWIDNLTAPDVLFSWCRPIFFIGNEFHLLPLILGVVMFIQQRFSSPTRGEKRELTDQERQQRAMGTFMAILFTVMFYHFPSGLNIYWLSSMLLGILQQWMTNRMMSKQK